MKPAVIALAVVATAAAIAAGVFAVLSLSDQPEEVASSSCEGRMFGHIASLVPKGDGYELRFDPAWFTIGLTANTAAAEDGVVAAGEPVPNDYYRVEEGHRLLTYLVPTSAQVTVLTRQGESFGPTPITVAELAELVDGGRPVELFESLDTGVWIRIDADTVCSLEHQYLP